jgi:hypothetical protein
MSWAMLFGNRCKCGSRSFVRLPRGPLKCTDCGAFKWGPAKRKRRLHPFLVVAVTAAVAIGSGLALAPQNLNALSPGCVIKGNISREHGERIYHLPGDIYYDDTVINIAAGERWFCSEAEARAAGWRRAFR